MDLPVLPNFLVTAHSKSRETIVLQQQCNSVCEIVFMRNLNCFRVAAMQPLVVQLVLQQLDPQ